MISFPDHTPKGKKMTNVFLTICLGNGEQDLGNGGMGSGNETREREVLFSASHEYR